MRTLQKREKKWPLRTKTPFREAASGPTYGFYIKFDKAWLPGTQALNWLKGRGLKRTSTGWPCQSDLWPAVKINTDSLPTRSPWNASLPKALCPEAVLRARGEHPPSLQGPDSSTVERMMPLTPNGNHNTPPQSSITVWWVSQGYEGRILEDFNSNSLQIFF